MGAKGSGRKSKVQELRDSAQILHEAAPGAARYLRDVIKGTIKKPSWSRIEVCKFIIDHELGKAPIRHELTGAGGTPLTWQAVVLLAEEADQAGGLPKIVGGVRLIPAAPKPPEDGGDGGPEP